MYSSPALTTLYLDTLCADNLPVCSYQRETKCAPASRKFPGHNLLKSYTSSSRIASRCTRPQSPHVRAVRKDPVWGLASRDTSGAFLQNYMHVSRENLTGTSAGRVHISLRKHEIHPRAKRAHQREAPRRQIRPKIVGSARALLAINAQFAIMRCRGCDDGIIWDEEIFIG